MTTQAFEHACAVILREEGGYVNDPHDPGGETIYGISRRAHPGAWADTMPTLEVAKAIYFEGYWLPTRCADMPLPVAICVFDCAVNQGPGVAKSLIQRAAGVTVDGAIGPKTLAAIAAASPDALIPRFMQLRMARYQATSGYEAFGDGWTFRLFRVTMAASAAVKHI